ncbi:alpha/beta hydrolase family protein [Tropicibacter naphthalenivorans]|uniref:Putative dienelactone hydrolase n=1 Tax=Tropicibacter naphthalenivorans TaxID=441103 RepID=A0A0P1G0Z3_9RHOB|nr:hypothetical protein [Tropicibacter naphthalenivorans]CUH75416.1 putative dienelactone hydrolase [Tropicibacter naphthalenivorans]SMC44587.1 Predicted dienelactone hydrolase [Tropicibacter naphthalenivorans]
MRLFLRALAALGLLGLGLLAFVFFASARPFDPPAQVPGYRSLTLEVAHRDVPLPVHVWYPAETGTPELIGQNALFYGHHVRPDAPLPDTAPVVVFSHGSGGNAVQMGWLLADLANAGFVVVAPNHPGTTSRDSIPARTVMVWERTDDMTALLDWLDNGGLEGFRGTGTTLSAGFSLGGYTALALGGLRVSKARFIDYCDRNRGLVDCGWMQDAGVDFSTIDAARYDADRSDARITGVMALDPALPQAATPDSIAAFDTPAMVLNLGVPGAIPDAMRADTLAQALPGASYTAIPGAAHFSALPACSLMGKVVIGIAGDDNICSDRGLRDRRVIHSEILSTLRPFTSAFLE